MGCQFRRLPHRRQLKRRSNGWRSRTIQNAGVLHSASLDLSDIGADSTDDTDGYIFRTARRKTGQLTTNPLFQQDAHRIIRRRAKAAGIDFLGLPTCEIG
jgi:hypothetical protein